MTEGSIYTQLPKRHPEFISVSPHAQSLSMESGFEEILKRVQNDGRERGARMKGFWLLCFFLIILTSCKKKEPDPTPDISTNPGFFIVNEGNYTWGNSSLSFYDDVTGEIKNQVFYQANNVPLGDVANAMYIFHGKGFITINNSGRIYAIDPLTFVHIGTIQGLVSPRQILFLDEQTALISDLYDTKITIFNPETYAKTGTIETGCSTEGFAVSGNNIFVTCWSFQNKVLVIDKTSHAITDTLTLGVQPRWIQCDKNGTAWVLCDGGYSGNPAGFENPSFYTITPSFQVEKTLEFPSTQYATYGFDMNPAGDSIYFLCNGINAISLNDTVFPAQPIIPANGRNFYGVTVHPSGQKLIVTDAANFSSDGKMYIYSTSGQLLNTYTAGINPSWVCFRE